MLRISRFFRLAKPKSFTTSAVLKDEKGGTEGTGHCQTVNGQGKKEKKDFLDYFFKLQEFDLTKKQAQGIAEILRSATADLSGSIEKDQLMELRKRLDVLEPKLAFERFRGDLYRFIAGTLLTIVIVLVIILFAWLRYVSEQGVKPKTSS